MSRNRWTARDRTRTAPGGLRFAPYGEVGRSHGGHSGPCCTGPPGGAAPFLDRSPSLAEGQRSKKRILVELAAPAPRPVPAA